MNWSIFSKVNQILNFLKTNLNPMRTSKIEHIDTILSSRASSNTALNNHIWTNTRAEQIDLTIPTIVSVGTPSDLADSTGSIHAKLRDLKETIPNVGNNAAQLPQWFDFTQYTPSVYSEYFINLPLGQWTTIRDIQGGGFAFESFLLIMGYSPVSNCYFRITIDGDIVVDNFAEVLRVYHPYISSFSEDISFLSGFTLREFVKEYVDGRHNADSTNDYPINIFVNTINTGSHIVSYGEYIRPATTFPFVDQNLPRVALLYNPIKFNSSFKIEVMPTQLNPQMYVQSIVYLE